MSLSIKFYRNLCIVLLCINIAFLAFFFLKPRPHQGPPNGHLAKKHLRLSEQQRIEFVELVKQHKSQMTSYNHQQRLLVEQYFAPLINTDITVNSDSLLMAIKNLEQQKIEITYQHFEQVKAILKEEQYVHFENFINHAMHMILQKRKKRPH